MYKMNLKEKIMPKDQLLPIGTKVTFVNDYGVKFPRKTITGYFTTELTSGIHFRMYERGFRYFIDTDAPWMPVRTDQLIIEN
jgi:hypothetical protein